MHHFFANHKIEEDLVKFIIKSGFSMVECEANIKNTDVKNSIFEMLEQCLKLYKDELKYIMSENATKIINLLYMQENMAKPMAEFVGLCAPPLEENQLADEIIRELTKQIF